jgi:hypothetical protein
MLLFLLLIVILWIIPSYSVKLDPEPGRIPSIEEVLPANIVLGNKTELNTKEDFIKLIKPNDPVIKHVADKIAVISCEGNRICQAKAIYYFVRDNFEYISDPNAYEYVKSARESLLHGGGDCDDASVLLANLEEAIGIKTRFVFIPGHVYIQAYLPGALKKYKVEDNWINLDTTCNSCGFGEIPYQNIGKKATFINK